MLGLVLDTEGTGSGGNKKNGKDGAKSLDGASLVNSVSHREENGENPSRGFVVAKHHRSHTPYWFSYIMDFFFDLAFGKVTRA